jgi:serine phosphatase RsbU (regulator of sigma subunit)
MYDDALPISEHVFWVGIHDARDAFQCNPYVIRTNGAGVLIDPGSVLYFPRYLEKIQQVIDFQAVTHIVLQHQDPDVCGVIAQLAELLKAKGNTRFRIITHRRTAALVRHYGENLKFEYPDRFPDQKLALGGGHTLEFINTPYLHAPGAIATYFNTDKILFSSDIFGGMTSDWTLFAGESYFDDIRMFHEQYMPSKEILLFSMTQIERFDIEKIAPQHGSVMNRDQARKMIDAFKDFECGLFIDQSFRDELQAARKQIEEQNRIMNRELIMAGQFQQSLLPERERIRNEAHLDIAFLFKPHSQVSGDFLIIDSIDERFLGIMIVDVVDHGVTSGLATIQLKTLFEEYKRTSFSPARVLERINRKAFSISENDIFLCATYMVYDRTESVVTIASAGGIPPIYYRSARDESILAPVNGTCLGVLGAEDYRISDNSFVFDLDDCLILQTDGLMDSTNTDDIPFDRVRSQRRFMDEITKDKPAQEILDDIVKQVGLHTGEENRFDDDATIVVFKRKNR